MVREVVAETPELALDLINEKLRVVLAGMGFEADREVEDQTFPPDWTIAPTTKSPLPKDGWAPES